MSYNRCSCGKCGSLYATMMQSDQDIQNEVCPKCGEKELKIVGPMSFAEISKLFYGGG